jgi:hypothetical protein
MYHRVVVNGREELVDIRILVATMFRLLHPKFSPLSMLQKNVSTICTVLEGYCSRRKEEMELDYSERRKETIRQRARLTFMLRKIRGIRKNFQYVHNRQEFLLKYYNLVLDLEGMGLLTGFGVMESYSKLKLRGNPEVVSMRQMLQDNL